MINQIELVLFENNFCLVLQYGYIYLKDLGSVYIHRNLLEKLNIKTSKYIINNN